MKKLITNTIDSYLAGAENSALQMFAKQGAKYAHLDDKLLRALRSLYKDYARVEVSHQQCLALLSAMCYDMLPLGKGYDSAHQCLKLAKHPVLQTGYGISESIYLRAGGHPLTLKLTPDAPSSSSVSEIPQWLTRYYFSKNAYLFQISPKHDIYCYKDPYGSLVLLAAMVRVNSAVLCDEEEMEGPSPLYFTESSHFVSPVYRLEMAEFLLRELMQLVGYPYLRIRHKVLYTQSEVRLINAEDMWKGDWFGRDLENILMGEHPKCLPLESAPEVSISPGLFQVLQVARALFDELRDMNKNDIRKFMAKCVQLKES